MLKGIKKKIPTPKPKTVKLKPIEKVENLEYYPEMVKELEALGFKVSFIDEDTYQITKNGRTDTGSVFQPLNIIIASARRLG